MKLSRLQIGLAACAVLAFLLVCYVWLRDREPATPPVGREAAGATPMTNVPTVHTEQTVVHLPATDLPRDGSPRADEVVGIGAALRMDNRSHTLRIMNVLPGTPAAQAGLSAGLIIHKVDDVLVTGLPLQECVSLIRGPIGSIVRLELIDPEQEETNTVELIRQKLQL